MSRNRYSKLLDLHGVLLAPRSKSSISTDGITNPAINVLNANKAGLFTDRDILELEARIERERLAKDASGKRPKKSFKRVTISNATQEELRNALHKVTFKK